RRMRGPPARTPAIESSPMKILRSAAAAVPVALALATARAEDPSLAVPPGPGQQALALRVEGGGVRAHVCAAAPCTPDGGTVVTAPEGPRPVPGKAKAAAITLAGGRAVARVDVPGDAQGSTWVLLVAAPLAGKGAEPVVRWSGWTGVSRGEEGEEHGAVVH